MDPFIPAHTDLNDPDSPAWRHFANLSRATVRSRWREPSGLGLLNSLNAARFSREALEKLVGRFAGKFDLRGIPLAQADLSRLDLHGVDFFYADLSKAVFTGCNLSASHLSECDIRGAIFDWANLDGALLDNVQFDRETSFLGVDLNRVNFTLATLLYDLALSQQRIQQLNQHHKVFAWFLRVSCDYGRSFRLYALWVAFFILGFAKTYQAMMGHSFLNCLYFSIVTFATVGYGDIVPQGTGQTLAVISEIMIGYLMGGLLIAILAKRVIG